MATTPNLATGGRPSDVVRQADLAAIARAYGIELEKEGAEWKARCPFHTEDTPSWKIFKGRDGKARYECFGCSAKGDAADLVRHMENLPDAKATLARLHEIVHGTAPPQAQQPAVPSASPAAGTAAQASKGTRKRRTKPGRELAVYDYHDAAGALVFQVVRKELIDAATHEVVGKTFLQRHQAADGSYVWNLDGIERVLYRLPAVLRADRVWLVEGEKDVHTLEGLGLVATTIPGGARANWAPGFTLALAGRQVVLCGDGDKPGQEHMARAALELRSAAAALFKATMPEGVKDVTDYVTAGHALADLEAAVQPLQLPAVNLPPASKPIIEFPNPSRAGAGPRNDRGPGGGGGGGGGGWLPPDGTDGPDPHWQSYLDRNREGLPRAIFKNALIALRLAPQWNGALWFNRFTNIVVARRPFPGEDHVTESGVAWSDHYDMLATDWLQHHGIYVNPDIAAKAVQTAARGRSFHPVHDYLEGLKWDGEPRIEHWLIDHGGVEDSEYVRAVSARWLISAVARVYKPGCKADCCLILESHRQGAFKSTTFKVLGSPWYADDISDLGSKDAAMQAQGVWILELAELDSMRRVEAGKVKAFMSRSTDRFRPPYGRHVIESPRQCVFAGTVNQAQYLPDETGNRRFWPVSIPDQIDIEAVRAAKDQLWAEAMVRYRAGHPWYLDSKLLVEAAEQEQDARHESDPWQMRIREFLQGRREVTVDTVLEFCIQKPLKDWTRQDKLRVGSCIRSLKWVRFQPVRDGERVSAWRPSFGGVDGDGNF